MNLPNAEQVSAEFSRILRSWLTPNQIAEAIELNRSEESSGVCHSHDHCDANMAMHEALEVFGLGEYVFSWSENDPLSVPVNKLWNDAWDLAKATEFRVDFELECMVANDALGG